MVEKVLPTLLYSIYEWLGFSTFRNCVFILCFPRDSLLSSLKPNFVFASGHCLPQIIQSNYMKFSRKGREEQGNQTEGLPVLLSFGLFEKWRFCCCSRGGVVCSWCCCFCALGEVDDEKPVGWKWWLWEWRCEFGNAELLPAPGICPLAHSSWKCGPRCWWLCLWSWWGCCWSWKLLLCLCGSRLSCWYEVDDHEAWKSGPAPWTKI